MFVNGSGNQKYEITNSLRFDGANQYALRIPTIGLTETSNLKKTYSVWCKRDNMSATYSMLYSHYYNDTNVGFITFNAAGNLYVYSMYGGVTQWSKITNTVYRDPAAWYHVVVTIDTTQAVADDRVAIYVNGSKVTSFSTNTTAVAQNAFAPLSFLSPVGGTWYSFIGSYTSATYHYSGHLAEYNIIDGLALTPNSFGQVDANTGQWVPKKYTGPYGVNGAYLDFKDGTSVTTLGYDKSGNGWHYPIYNVARTGLASSDCWTTDTPTNSFNTLSRLAGVPTIVGGSGLSCYYPSTATWGASPSNICRSSGKWYWEVTVANLTGPDNLMIGIAKEAVNCQAVNYYPGQDALSYGYIATTGNKYNSGASSAYGASYYVNGTVIGVAMDLDAGTLTFYKDGVSQGVAFTSIVGSFGPMVGSASGIAYCNFGQLPVSGGSFYSSAGGHFRYAPPAGFKSLCSKNLPLPLVTKDTALVAAKKYTGDGSTQTIDVGFQPDLTFIMPHVAASTSIFDSARGPTKRKSMQAGAETTDATSLTAFTSNGFSLGALAAVNNNAAIFTSLNIKKQTGFFDIVTYTGNGANRTIAHSLGVAPDMIMIVPINSATDTFVYIRDRGNLVMNYFSTSYAEFSSATNWNSTDPTSSVFSLGTSNSLNLSGTNYVAYLFRNTDGLFKCGSYTGNGSADGSMIHLGFKPAIFWQRAATIQGQCRLFDNANNPSNVANNFFYTSINNAMLTTGYPTDFISNGVKCRSTTSGEMNGSAQSYAYFAFGESPFKYSNAR